MKLSRITIRTDQHWWRSGRFDAGAGIFYRGRETWKFLGGNFGRYRLELLSA